ncbi:hypothetical protein Tco_0660845 [Tanacetum coccineum]
MAGLEFCSKHNMVAYLEKTDGNTEFHQIMDFLTRSSIYYALTVSPIVSTSFVEQFWTTAKSRTVNNISYIDATVAGKPVTISEASIRSDLLFDDADGIDSLNNQAIFDNIQLMGNQLKDVPVPLDHFPVPTLTKKVLTFMIKKGEASERPSDSQPIPSPPHLSEDQPQTQPDLSPRPSPTIHIPDSILEGSGGNYGDQAKEIKHLKKQIKKLKTKAKPVITHHKAWMKSVALKTRLARKTSLKKKGVQKGSVVLEEKESTDKEVSIEAYVSTVKPNKGTDKRDEGTDRQGEVRINRRKRKKGVEIRNVEDTKRPRTTSTRSVLTLKPLPKIDPKDKGKKMIDEEGESDTKSDDITKAEKKFKMLAKDKEVARKVQEEWKAKKEKKMLAEEEATKVALTNEYDFIQARINADKILADELQKEEREKFTIEQRAKFLHDTIATQRKFIAQQRLKRQDQNFVAIGSAKDERQIKELNKDPKKKRVIKETPREEDTAKVPAEQEVTEQDDGSDDEHRKCLRIVTFDSTIDSEIIEIKYFIARLHKVSSPDGNYLVVYRVNGHFRAFNYLMEQYSKITPEDIELILWGDLKIMMESSTEENDQGDFWNNQQEWEIVRWRLYEACGVCILELKDVTVIYMLVERRVLNSPCFTVKNWLVNDQTVPELAIPEQTPTGKEISNSLMAGSLPKTTKPDVAVLLRRHVADKDG